MRTKCGCIFFGLALFLIVAAPLAAAEKPILIGAPMPLTGPYASDGEQMKMALELGVSEVNAAGGLLGRELKIIYGDVVEVSPENVKAVGERLLGAGVDVVLTGYDSPGAVNVKVYGGGQHIPYLHGNAKTACTELVAKDPQTYSNVFQYTYSEIVYGKDAVDKLFKVPEQIGWTPPNKKVAIVKVDYPYASIPAVEFGKLCKQMGYEVVVDETHNFGMVEWGPILSKIEAGQPSFITFWNPAPADAAAFMNQFVNKFAAKGFPALMYMQYVPSMPEFLQLTGKNADGLVWAGGATDTGPKYQEFKKRWMDKFGKEPVGLYSHCTYDAFNLWVEAVKKVGCADCYDKVCDAIRTNVYVGLGGTYKFDPVDQSALPGDDLFPIGWNQIQDGKHVAITPARLATGTYKLPPWIKQ
jgi:branched-chain amino acid transport system substrate-binding protein